MDPNDIPDYDADEALEGEPEPDFAGYAAELNAAREAFG